MVAETMKSRRSLHYFKLWQTIGWLLVAAVIYLTLTPSPPHIDVLTHDKLQHGLGYLCLMLWFGQLYKPARHLQLAVSLIFLGIVLEVLQGVSGLRQFEFLDMLANSVGVLIGWLLNRTLLGTLLLRLEQRLGATG
jgi:VanZ family protein